MQTKFKVFLEGPVDHLYASPVFIDHIRALNLNNLTIASPDMGGSKRANAYAKHLGCEMVICYKHRKKANEIGDMRVIGDVAGKNIILGRRHGRYCRYTYKSSRHDD